MPQLIDSPRLVFVITFVCLCMAMWWGATTLASARRSLEGARSNLGVIQTTTLTLLVLIISFSFSMALERYDARKNLEEGEANAIGTELLRADLLPATTSQNVKQLLKQYTDLRIAFYTERDDTQLAKIAQSTTAIQQKLWIDILALAQNQPTPITALAVSGMNDVFNSQGYTHAAWSNRIPIVALFLLFAVALCGAVILGLGARHFKAHWKLFLVIPFIVSLSFFLIADIDSPRHGIILVIPQNLISLFN